MNSTRPYTHVKNFLMEIIEQENYTPNYKLPSERMLAFKFKASRRSVRLAYESLIEQGFVAKAHGKGYFTTGNEKPYNKDTHLSFKKIYFIVPALRTIFMQDILNGITDFCDEHALDVSIKISKGDAAKETQYINSAFTSDTKGIILFPLDNEKINNALLKLSANRYPVAIIDRYFKNINSSFISTDNYNAMVEAVKFLHTKKHKHILYLSPSPYLASTIEERMNGYRDGLIKYYGEAKDENLLIVEYFAYEKLYENVITYLKAHPQTEVLIIPGVPVATDAVISAINALGLSIPKDIKLMLFDSDFSTTEINLIRPYVIKQDAYQIGYKSAATLYNQIYGDLRTENILLPVNIVDYTKKT